MVERYLKFAGASLCLLAVGACARFETTQRAPEPRIGQSPEVLQSQLPSVAEQEAVLETEADALAANAADLQLAIAVMGPLPDPHAGLVLATWPDAAKPAGPRTIYRKVAPPISTAKLAELALPFPVTADTRLVVSSLPAVGTQDALCVELAALAGACRPAAPVRAYR